MQKYPYPLLKMPWHTLWNIPATGTSIVFICSRTIGYIHGRKIWERLTQIQKLYSEVVPDLQIVGPQESLFCAIPVLYIPPETAVPARLLTYRDLWACTADLMLLVAVLNNICFCKCWKFTLLHAQIYSVSFL